MDACSQRSGESGHIGALRSGEEPVEDSCRGDGGVFQSREDRPAGVVNNDHLQVRLTLAPAPIQAHGVVQEREVADECSHRPPRALRGGAGVRPAGRGSAGGHADGGGERAVDAGQTAVGENSRRLGDGRSGEPIEAADRQGRAEHEARTRVGRRHQARPRVHGSEPAPAAARRVLGWIGHAGVVDGQGDGVGGQLLAKRL